MNTSEPSTPVNGEVKRRRVTRMLVYFGLAVVIAVASGMTLKIVSLALTDLDSRLARIEVREATLDGAALSGQIDALRGQVRSLESGLADSRRQAAAMTQQLAAQSGQGSETAALRQALTALETKQQAQETQLGLLSQQLEQLRSSRPQASATKAPASSPRAGKVSKMAIKSRAAGRAAPFILTGVERRGTGSWAAVAPRGYSSLSQIALIGEGESVAGWTLVRAGHGQASFRVNGRTVLVNVQ